jgi:hypothetical protein
LNAAGRTLMNRTWRHVGFLIVVLFFIAGANAQMPDLTKTPLPAKLLAPEAKVASAAGITFLEGPAVDAEGNVFFSDIQGNRILKMDKSGAVTTFLAAAAAWFAPTCKRAKSKC